MTSLATLGFCAFTVAALCGCKSPAQLWSTAPDMTIPRHDHSTTLLADGRVLIAGGSMHESSLDTTDSVEIFDPRGNRWTSAAALPRTLTAHTATLLQDGRILVAGGCIAHQFACETGAAALYDPAADSWSNTASMGIARASHAALRLADGRVLVAGGYSPGPHDGGVALESIEIYDPRTGQWTFGANMPHARISPQIYLLPDGSVLLAGGEEIPFDTPAAPERIAQRYDPARDLWQVLPTVPEAMRFQASRVQTALIPGKTGAQLLVTSTHEFMPSDAADMPSGHQLMLDLSSGQWNETDMPFAPRTGSTLLALASGDVLLTGGDNGDWTLSDTAWRYDSATGQWRSLPPMPHRRADHVMTMLEDGRVMISGGRAQRAEPFDLPGYPAADLVPASPVSGNVDIFDPRALDNE